jgi:hypothetical protein
MPRLGLGTGLIPYDPSKVCRPSFDGNQRDRMAAIELRSLQYEPGRPGSFGTEDDEPFSIQRALETLLR